MTPKTYTTDTGGVWDLTDLEPQELAYLMDAHDRVMRALAAPTVAESQDIVEWTEFHNETVQTETNPALRETHGFITREIWDHSALYRALYDLDARLAMKQGALRRPRGSRWLRDPFEDEFLPASEVAKLKGVSRYAVDQAIERGDLVAVEGELSGPGPQRGILVSRNSAVAWEPNRAQQARGRRRARRGVARTG